MKKVKAEARIGLRSEQVLSYGAFLRKRSRMFREPAGKDGCPTLRQRAPARTRRCLAMAAAGLGVALVLGASRLLAQASYQPYGFIHFAGSLGGPGYSDGTGSAARFGGPAGVAVDSSGKVYVGGKCNDTNRKITPGGVVTTLAGLTGVSGSDDGTGSAARFNLPGGVAVDS